MVNLNEAVGQDTVALSFWRSAMEALSWGIGVVCVRAGVCMCKNLLFGSSDVFVVLGFLGGRVLGKYLCGW